MKPRIILASASPRRRVLLNRVLDDFEVTPSNAPEHAPEGQPPEETAVGNALAKAMDVAGRHPDALVIGADTVVVLNGRIMGKPRDRNHAMKMLGALSGMVHVVITGVALVHAGEGLNLTDSEATEVTFRRLSPEQIERYVDGRNPMDKAGAYGIQETDFAQGVNGDYDNVMGLPLKLLRNMLARAGVPAEQP